MKLGGSRREDEFEINVISLIDVLLTLLMFFTSPSVPTVWFATRLPSLWWLSQIY